MAFDAARSASVLFGGSLPDYLGARSGETWEFGIPRPTCDHIDYNQDGLFPDIFDIADFLSVFAGGVCNGQGPSDPPCNSDIDFNNDALFPDTADIESLLTVFAGGDCA